VWRLYEPGHGARGAFSRHRRAAARDGAARALGEKEEQERWRARYTRRIPRALLFHPRPHGQRSAAAAAPLLRRLPRRLSGSPSRYVSSVPGDAGLLGCGACGVAQVPDLAADAREAVELPGSLVAQRLS